LCIRASHPASLIPSTGADDDRRETSSRWLQEFATSIIVNCPPCVPHAARFGVIDRSVERSPSARPSDRPKHRRVAFRASFGSTEVSSDQSPAAS
jgi:hypothetical protein